MIRVLSLLTPDLHTAFFRGVPGAARIERVSPQDLQAALRRSDAQVVVFDPLAMRSETATDIARSVRRVGARVVLVAEPTPAAAKRLVAVATQGEAECILVGECPPETLLDLLGLGCDASATGHLLHQIAPRLITLARTDDTLAVIRLFQANGTPDTPESSSQRRRFLRAGLRSASVMARASRVCEAYDRRRGRMQSQWSLAERAGFGGERSMYNAFKALTGLPPRTALGLEPNEFAARVAAALVVRPTSQIGRSW